MMTGFTRLRSALAFALVVAGCSPTSAQLVVRAGETCGYDGPLEIRAADAEIVVFPQGLGDVRVDLYQLQDGTTYEDVEAHFRQVQPAHHPPGATRILGIATGNSIDGTSRSHEFTRGTYVIVCEWDFGDIGPARRPIAQVKVSG